MSDTFVIVLIGVGVINLVLLFIVWQGQRRNSSAYINERLESSQEKIERALKDEISRNREEMLTSARDSREELSGSLRSVGNTNAQRMSEIAEGHNNQLDSFAKQLAGLTEATERRLETMRTTIEARLTALQEDNGRKLDQMRGVVDEKLQLTLEKRLGENFNLVAQRLELIHRGLGEMQALASGVGDLKRILSNVRTRGTFGEWQLSNLLDDVMSPNQFERNVATRKGSNERVEFALKLPGQDGALDKEVLLPIDAKFPKEDYERLLDAYEQADPILVEEASKQLERRVKEMAKNIRDKYLNPPDTTDFGIMYLPSESLFAEVIRRPGMCEVLQRDYRVIITGPTTLATLLNCLQVGFKTLAIAKRSSEVWELLGAVKSEFGKFGDLLDKTKKKLDEASNTIEDAARKSRTIERKLKEVQESPPTAAGEVMGDVSIGIEGPLFLPNRVQGE